MAPSQAVLELIVALKDQASAGLADVGSLLRGLPGLALAGGTLAAGALAGVGAAALDLGSQMRTAQNDIQAQLGATADEAARLGGMVADIYANNWGDSIADVNASLITTRQQMRGLQDDADLQAATQSAIALRDVFGIDIPESTNAANTLMSQFNLTQQQAFDFIASGMQQGLNASGDFLDTIGEYSTQFANGGASADQFFSLMQTGMQGGVLGTDKAADSFKEFRLRIQDGSQTTAAGLAQLGIDAADLNSTLSSGAMTAADAYQLVIRKLQETTDPTIRMQAGAALIGSQFEDLGDNAVLGLDLTKTALTDLTGATEGLNAKYDSLGSMWEGVSRQMLVELAPLGQELLRVANDAMPVVLESGRWLAGLLKDHLPGAIQATRDGWADMEPRLQAAGRLWRDDIQPALERTWAFLDAYIFPILGALGSVAFAGAQKGGEALMGFWQHVLLPGLEAFHAFAQQYILPTLDAWGLGFDGIAQKLRDLRSFLDGLASGFANLQLPDWLTPGSPTPLEIALGGLRREFGNLASQELPRFEAGLDLTTPTLTTPTLPTGGGGGGQTVIIQNLTIPLANDAATILPQLLEELRRYQTHNVTTGLT